jgi:hypothetical protein
LADDLSSFRKADQEEQPMGRRSQPLTFGPDVAETGRTRMKLRATSLFWGLGLALLAASASPAYSATRSTTAYSAFKVEYNTLSEYKGNPYFCLFEDNGAVVNHCSYTVSLEFDLPIDSKGTKNILIQDGWAGLGTGSEEFTCVSFAYNGMQSSSTVGSTATFTGPGQAETTSVLVTDDNGIQESIQVLCNVPPGDAVANFNWNP